MKAQDQLPEPVSASNTEVRREAPPGGHRAGIDAELVRKVLSGEVSAFEALMRRHNQRMFRAARAVLREDADAQDATQQAWLAVYAHLAQWDGRAAFASWAVRIAVHEAARRLRSRAREPMLRSADDIAEPSPLAGPEDSLQRAQIRNLLERAIDMLPEHMRVVFVLRDLSDLSGAEAAAALGLSEEAVRVRLHRARRLLRGMLEETLDANMTEVFPFLGARCDAITHAVLAEIERGTVSLKGSTETAERCDDLQDPGAAD